MVCVPPLSLRAPAAHVPPHVERLSCLPSAATAQPTLSRLLEQAGLLSSPRTALRRVSWAGSVSVVDAHVCSGSRVFRVTGQVCQPCDWSPSARGAGGAAGRKATAFVCECGVRAGPFARRVLVVLASRAEQDPREHFPLGATLLTFRRRQPGPVLPSPAPGRGCRQDRRPLPRVRGCPGSSGSPAALGRGVGACDAQRR